MTDAQRVERIVAALLGVYRGWRRDTPVTTMRRDWDALFRPRARPWPIVRENAGGVPAEWIAAPDADPRRAVLYLHGGGFRLGSIDSHRDLLQRLSEASRARVLAVDYRLSPECPHPAALEDSFAAWRWLCARPGVENPAIAGDSAGGALALMTMSRARDAGAPPPAAAVLMSPWTDFTASGASYDALAGADPIHGRAMLLAVAEGYFGADPAVRRAASPLFADLAGLPRVLAQCGAREVVVDDSRTLVERLRGAGGEAALEVFDGMIHVFQMFGELDAARRALASAGAFLQAAWR